MKRKMNNIWVYSLVLTLLIGIASCSKDKTVTPTPDPTSILTSTTWKDSTIDPQTEDMSLLFAASFYAGFNEASVFTFKAGGVLNYTVLISELTGTWSLAADNKTLTIKDDKGVVISTFTILEAKTGLIKMQKTYTKAQLGSSSDVTVQFIYIPKI
jgi:hypothetical protein